MRTGLLAGVFSVSMVVLSTGYVVVPAQAMPQEAQLAAPFAEAGYQSDFSLHVNMTAVSGTKTAISDNGAGARNFIDNMATRALGFLASETMSHDQKTREFKRLLEDSFDMGTIGRFSLGRYWRVSTKPQREEYQKLFREMVVNVYSARFLEYKGEKFETRSYRADGEKDTIVTSFIMPHSGPDIQIDWRVRQKNGRYKVVDVIVEGVSMSMTQRSDFAAVIQRGGGDVQVLLSHLRAQ